MRIGIVCPALYYTNTWYAKYMPISASISFDNTGASYDVSKILSNGTQFDQAKYEAYSPLFLTTTNALTYAVSFAIFPAACVHTFRKLPNMARLPYILIVLL